MGVLDSIKEKIFGKPAAAPAKPAPATPAASQTVTKMPPPPPPPVDVEAVIEAAVKAKGVKSNWRESIVDLMKALDLDSSLTARKELAKDLKYSGTDPDGSAEKNIWLHKALMKALAENGGKVPSQLLK